MRIVALATPGHRPEHTAYLVEDRSRGEEPWMVLTGDSLFVGDLARPDLAVEARDGARELHRSLRRLLDLDDFVEVWPGHIGGSLCGGAGMSETPGSTIGFERRFNRLLRLESEEAFVDELTRHLPPQPPNFTRIVALNRGPLLRHAAALEPLTPQRVEELLAAGATLLDGREPREYAAGHVPGSLNVTMVNAAVGTRAAWVVDPETEVIVTAAERRRRERMARMLEAVGFRCDPRLPRRRRRPRGPTPAARPSRRRRSTWRRSPTACATATSSCSTSARTTSGRTATSPARCTCPTTISAATGRSSQVTTRHLPRC